MADPRFLRVVAFAQTGRPSVRRRRSYTLPRVTWPCPARMGFSSCSRPTVNAAQLPEKALGGVDTRVVNSEFVGHHGVCPAILVNAVEPSTEIKAFAQLLLSNSIVLAHLHRTPATRTRGTNFVNCDVTHVEWAFLLGAPNMRHAERGI